MRMVPAARNFTVKSPRNRIRNVAVGVCCHREGPQGNAYALPVGGDAAAGSVIGDIYERFVSLRVAQAHLELLVTAFSSQPERQQIFLALVGFFKFEPHHVPGAVGDQPSSKAVDPWVVILDGVIGGGGISAVAVGIRGLYRSRSWDPSRRSSRRDKGCKPC
jgi:hypothetical protein